MAVIVDPDTLNDGVELTISTALKTIKLNIAGNLSSDGVTLKCVYSKLKELWNNSANYIKFPFPIQPITDEQFELINGWDFDKTGAGNNLTPNLIRTGGWAKKDAAGVSEEEWAGIVTLGSLAATDQVYFQQAAAGAAVNVVRQGAVNQAVQVYKTGAGAFDYRTYFKVFVREYQKLYAAAQLSDIGVQAMTYQVYRFPLSNAADLKVTDNDGAMTGAPFNGMSITWYGAPQAKMIGATPYNFHVVIDANGGTAQQVYEFVQYQLRQNTDIDAGAGTKPGKTAADLLKFVGDTLYTIQQSEGGVFINNFAAADLNNVFFVDDASAQRSFPYAAALTLQFGENLVLDASAIFRVYFSNDDAGDNSGRDFGTANALTVNDKDGAPLNGNVGGAASIQKTFDYDGNVQRGAASAGVDAPITVVAIGLSTGQYVKATGVIQKSKANVISLVAPLERNYANPA